ncbi:MAG TPA: hypothetical protein VNE40_02820 [Candidatus Dormibacteraeota bacterium]|nr:hypothetical protein [Candidatus Dormibacteraeota bacterium]
MTLNLRTSTKTFGLILFLVLSAFYFVKPPSVFASGETYTWSSYQTIKVSGGGLSNDSSLSFNINSTGFGLPNATQSFLGSLQVKDSNGQACQIFIFLNVAPDNKSGVITNAQPVQETTSVCQYKYLSNLASQYNGSTVSIGGQRPNDNSIQETLKQKQVFIFVYPKTTVLPSNVIATITDAAGKVTSVQLTQQGESSNRYYSGSTGLDPGIYKLCSTPSMGRGCATEQKVKFNSNIWSLGESLSTQIINVTVELVNNTGVQNNSIDPITVSLEKPDGTPITTADTNPLNITPTSDQSQAAGAVTVNSTYFVRTEFTNVSPDNYRVCIQNDTICQNVTKTAFFIPPTVKLNLSDTQSSGLINQTGGSTTPTCESSGYSLSWFMCPIINGLADAVDGIYHTFIQPLLVTQPIVLSVNGDPTNTYKIWSNFRVYGDIFLVIALLVIVFGQSIGGGLIDAYSAKKILPRLMIAAVLINLSIYIVAFSIDITNILGNGIQGLLSQPFANANSFQLKLSGGTSATLGIGALLTGTTAGAAGIGLWAAIAAGTVELGPLILFVLLSILLPALLTFIAILGTVLIRRGLIIFLVVISPVAFALYCLPNTEKYFRKWWDLLFRTLLVYPIIALIFSISNILSVTINQSGQTSGLISWVSQLMSIVALIVPLFLIPFSFKLSGGVLGKVHEITTGVGKRGYDMVKGNPNNPFSLQNKVKREAGNSIRDLREIRGAELMGSGSRVARRIGRSLGGARLAERQAVTNTERAQAISTTWNSGNDTWAKASTIPLSVLATRRASGHRYRAANAAGNTTGREQWSAADGTWFDEAQIREGNRTYGNGADRQINYQKLLEKTEPLGTDSQNAVLDDFLDWATQAGLDGGTASGRWQGISIPLKGMRIDLRRAQIGRGANGRLIRTGTNHFNLLTEYAGMAMPEQYKETPGSFEAVRDSILHVGGNTAATQEENEAAARAYHNLEQYVKGTSGSPTQQALAQQALAQQPGQATGAGTQQSYASSSSAAAKNRNAAQQALADLDAQARLNPALAQVIAQLPRDIT